MIVFYAVTRGKLIIGDVGYTPFYEKKNNIRPYSENILNIDSTSSSHWPPESSLGRELIKIILQVKKDDGFDTLKIDYYFIW